jgi:outer membrane protein assembly factor BamB
VHRQFNILKAPMFYEGLLLRRRDCLLVFLVSLLLFQLYGVAKSGADASSSGDDWPMFLHDPSHTGSTASAGPSEPVELWRFPVGDAVVTSAAVVNGVVYVEGNDGIYALDAYTGTELWSYPMPYHEMYSSPAVSEGVLFAGAAGKLLALDASSGTEVWSYPTAYPKDRVISSPAVVDGVVYFGALYDNVYALRASTGEKIWNHTVRLGVDSAPAVSGGVVYVSSTNGILYALNAESGEEIWRFRVSDMLQRIYGYSPTVADGVVYVRSSDGGELYAVDASTGDLKWENPGSFYVRGSATIVGGVVYSGTSALNASTGEELWHFSTESNKVSASPAVSNGVLYVASMDGYFYAIGEPLTTPPPTPTPEPENPFPTAWIIITVAVLAVFGLILLVYFKKRKH